MLNPKFTKPFCVLLAACLLLAPIGCRTGAERAGDHRALVEVGMTQEQVENILGGPDGWQENVGGYEVWKYAYRPNFGHFLVWRTVDATEIVITVAIVVGVFWGLLSLLDGHWAGPPSLDSGPSRTSTSFPSPSASGRFQRFTFTICFDRETGRVAFISSPLPE